jgi:surfactin synthase thioesterase subunit
VSAPTLGRPAVLGDWFYLPTPQGRPDTRQVVCLPHAGGDVTAFAGLAAALAPDLEVWAVRLPGRGGRFAEPMPRRFDALVRAVTDGIRPLLRPGSVFYGQSFGALLGYEVARALPPELRPTLLVPACASAPPAWQGTVPDGDAGAADLLRRCGLADTLPDSGDIRELALAVVRADLTVCRDYRYRAHPACAVPIHALIGADDPMIRPFDTAAWAGVTTGPFAASVVPGGHLLASALSTGPADLLRSLSRSHQGADRVHQHR